MRPANRSNHKLLGSKIGGSSSLEDMGSPENRFNSNNLYSVDEISKDISRRAISLTKLDLCYFPVIEINQLFLLEV